MPSRAAAAALWVPPQTRRHAASGSGRIQQRRPAHGPARATTAQAITTTSDTTRTWRPHRSTPIADYERWIASFRQAYHYEQNIPLWATVNYTGAFVNPGAMAVVSPQITLS